MNRSSAAARSCASCRTYDDVPQFLEMPSSRNTQLVDLSLTSWPGRELLSSVEEMRGLAITSATHQRASGSSFRSSARKDSDRARRVVLAHVAGLNHTAMDDLTRTFPHVCVSIAVFSYTRGHQQGQTLVMHQENLRTRGPYRFTAIISICVVQQVHVDVNLSDGRTLEGCKLDRNRVRSPYLTSPSHRHTFPTRIFHAIAVLVS